MKELFAFVAAVLWVAGVVIASGFWSTLFAAIFPFWSWYLIVEMVMTKAGLI